MKYFTLREMNKKDPKISLNVLGFEDDKEIIVQVGEAYDGDSEYWEVSVSLYNEDSNMLRSYSRTFKEWNSKGKLSYEIKEGVLSVFGISSASSFEVRVENIQGDNSGLDFKILSLKAEDQKEFASGDISREDILSGDLSSRWFTVKREDSDEDKISADIHGYEKGTRLTAQVYAGEGGYFELKLEVYAPMQEEPIRSHGLSLESWNNSCALEAALSFEGLDINIVNGTEDYTLYIKNQAFDEPGIVFDVWDNEKDEICAEWGYCTEEDILGEDGWEKKYA